MYGKVELDEEETEALRLSPKFGLFRKLNASMSRIDVEEALNKLRWNRIIEDSARDRNGRHQEQQGETGEQRRWRTLGGLLILR